MEAQRHRRWDPVARRRGYVNIVGSTVLINGVGGIGAETARLCAALGAKVVGIDPRPEHDCPAEVHSPSALGDLLPAADFVVTTAPHTPESEFMWNADRFRRMKPSAYFINIGRGMTASLDDLTAALVEGEIAGAGLDVFEIRAAACGASALDSRQRVADTACRHRGRRGRRRAALLVACRQRAPLPRRRAPPAIRWTRRGGIESTCFAEQIRPMRLRRIRREVPVPCHPPKPARQSIFEPRNIVLDLAGFSPDAQEAMPRANTVGRGLFLYCRY